MGPGRLGRFSQDAQVASSCAFNLSGFEGNPGSALLGSLRMFGQ
jgi:hypothetical protein